MAAQSIYLYPQSDTLFGAGWSGGASPNRWQLVNDTPDHAASGEASQPADGAASAIDYSSGSGYCLFGVTGALPDDATNIRVTVRLHCATGPMTGLEYALGMGGATYDLGYVPYDAVGYRWKASVTQTTNPHTGAAWTPAQINAGLSVGAYGSADTASISAIELLVEYDANLAPVAEDGTLAATPEIAAAGQAVATDAEGDTLTFATGTAPAKGVIVWTNEHTGEYAYTANAGTTGEDTFTFTANDGTADSNEATITVTINTPPVAEDDTLAVPFETPVAGQLTATDVDDDPLTYALDTLPVHGDVELNTDTGAFVYTPDDGYDGEDTFTFHANDGTADSNTATISVTVDAEPPANPPTGDWTYEQGCQVLVTDASGIEAGAGEEIVAIAWSWGDDTANGAGVVGKHIYDIADTYSVTCTVQYAGGELFSYPKSIPIIPIDFTLQQFGNIVLVDAGENQPPASSGYTISAYAWAWGDGSAYGSGVATSHRYVLAGSYLIVLALTIEGHILYAQKGVTIMSDTATSGLQADSNQHLILDAAAITLNYGDAETERVLGVTRGGTRVTLQRTHRNMEPDGALGPVKGFRRLETVAPILVVPMLDMRVENLLVALAGSTGTEEGETTVIAGAEVADADYIDNVAFVARYSGSDEPIIFVLKNVLVTTPFDLQTADKNEPVLELTFEAHFDPATPRVEPWEIIHPLQAASGS